MSVTNPPVADPVDPPVADPPSDPPAAADPPADNRPAHSADALPKWAQDELRKARDDAAKARRDKKALEEAQLVEQGKYKELAEARETELAALRATLAENDRMVLARKVAKDVLGALVTDTDAVAKRLTGTTEEELKRDAESFKAALPKPSAANTEGGSGRPSGGVATGMSYDQLKADRRASGDFAGL